MAAMVSMPLLGAKIWQPFLHGWLAEHWSGSCRTCSYGTTMPTTWSENTNFSKYINYIVVTYDWLFEFSWADERLTIDLHSPVQWWQSGQHLLGSLLYRKFLCTCTLLLNGKSKPHCKEWDKLCMCTYIPYTAQVCTDYVNNHYHGTHLKQYMYFMEYCCRRITIV